MAAYTTAKLNEKLLSSTINAINFVKDGGNIDDYDGIVHSNLLDNIDNIINRQDIYFIIPIRNQWEKKKCNTLSILDETITLLRYATFTSDLSWNDFNKFDVEVANCIKTFNRDQLINVCIKWLLFADYYDDCN